MDLCHCTFITLRNFKRVVIVMSLFMWSTSFGCLDGWILNENFSLCYYRSTIKTNFQSAKQICESYNGSLVMPKTQEEDNFVKLHLLSNINDNFVSWMGMSDLATEGDWIWVDGTSLIDTNYTNWVPGDPNNYQDSEHCVIFYRPQFGADIGWADAVCTDGVSFICQSDEICMTNLAILNTTGSLFTVGGYGYSDTLTYLCVSSQGPVYQTRTCLVNGIWSGSEPVCQLQDICMTSLDILNTTGNLVSVGGYGYLDTLTYLCNSPHGPIYENRTCLSNGSWSGFEPVCPLQYCPCLCNFTLNDAEFQEMIEDMKVDQKMTSKSQRLKISVHDDRPSAKAVGFIGVLLLTIVLSIIVLPDIPTLFIEIKRGMNNIKSRFTN